MKKIPMRMCIVTREKYPKMELIRVVNTDGGVCVDLTGKVNGHGCYLKKDEEVILKAKNKKILDNVLGVEVKEEIYEELLNLIK